MAELIRHGSCGKSWTGATRGHCSGCHETFTQGAFDRHFVRGAGEHPTCDPIGRGLVPHPQPWGTLWALPAPAGSAWWARGDENGSQVSPGGSGGSGAANIVNTALEAQDPRTADEATDGRTGETP